MSEWFESYGYAPVLPGLLVGAILLDANDVQVIAENRVDRVLNLAEEREYPDGARLEVEIALEVNAIAETRLQLVDFGNLSAAALDRAVGLVEAWLSAEHTVYLHCRAGWQRSAAIAAGVVALRRGLDIDAAMDFVQRAKPSANPLDHQREDLRRLWAARTPS